MGRQALVYADALRKGARLHVASSRLCTQHPAPAPALCTTCNVALLVPSPAFIVVYVEAQQLDPWLIISSRQ